MISFLTFGSLPECIACRIRPLLRLMPYSWHTFILLEPDITVDVIYIMSAVNLITFFLSATCSKCNSYIHNYIEYLFPLISIYVATIIINTVGCICDVKDYVFFLCQSRCCFIIHTENKTKHVYIFYVGVWYVSVSGQFLIFYKVKPCSAFTPTDKRLKMVTFIVCLQAPFLNEMISWGRPYRVNDLVFNLRFITQTICINSNIRLPVNRRSP
jgi:hypothetical protein